MTTNASRYGLRANAAAKSNKHAQRTPLPPRPGVIEAAQEAVAEAAQIIANETESTPDIKSWGKAAAFLKLAESVTGWHATKEARGEAAEVTLTRGAETIIQSWVHGVWQYDASVYAYGDRSTKPRNASGARNLLDRSEEDAAAEMSKVIANKHFRKREPNETPKAYALPFDPELATDEEVMAILRGQAVQWYNRISRGTESAIVGRGKNMRMTFLADGSRVVNMCCPVTGFRSFLVTAILKVGRGRVASAETAEIVLEDAA